MIKSEYLKNIFLVMFGTIGVQAVFFFSLPVITNVFSPEEYGRYSEILSYSLIISSVLNFGLDRSIPLSQEKNIDENSIFLIFISIIVSFVIFLVVWSLSFNDLDYIFVIILSLGISIFNIVSFRLMAKNLYKKEAVSRFYQAALMSLFQISSGAILATSSFLMMADFLSKILISLIYFPKFVNINFSRSMLFFKSKRSFYSYGLVSSILTSMSMNMPVILVGYFYGSAYVGAFFISQKLTTAPVTLLGSSISKAYYVKFNEILRRGKDAKDFYLYNLKRTVILGIVTVPIIYVLSAFIPFFFTAEWSFIADFIILLIPLLFGQMIYNPISMTITAVNKQKYDFLFSVLRVLGLLVIFSSFFYFGFSVFNSVLMYSIWMMVLYFFMAAISYYSIPKKL